MIKYVLTFLVLSSINIYSFSQNRIQGSISDKQSGEKLIGCNVKILGTTEGVITNNYGFFSVVTRELPVKLVFSYIGYTTDTIKFEIATQNINVALDPCTSNLKEVEISSTRNKIGNPQMGLIEIPMKQIKLLPTIGGEIDVLRVFQLMPGVQGGNEGTSGLYIRGGTPDQNLVLVDDIPLYYVNHIGGFISVFDINAINNVSLLKGAFPARYGGRLSSVIDIRMKSGNADSLKGEFGVGIMATRAFIEGPLLNNNTRFMVSARRCNLDLVSRLLLLNNEYSAGYTFYDLYSKVTHDFNSKNSVSFSMYNGRDNIFLNQDKTEISGSDSFYKYKGTINWGNTLASLKWNHKYSGKLFGSLTLAYTNFDYLNGNKFKEIDKSSNELLQKSKAEFNSGVKDMILRKDVDYFFNNDISIKLGVIYTSHIFNPGLNTYNNLSSDTTIGSIRLRSNEIVVYSESEIKLSTKVNANIGLHFNSYFVNNKTFPSLQPRLTINYTLKNDWSVKASYAYMQQNLHLLSNNGAGIPTDLWVPATASTRPQYSYLYSVGIEHFIKKTGIELSLEGYYKLLSNQIEFSEGASFFGGGNNWEDKIERSGKGKAYGIEFLLQKKQGRFNGWIGYSLSNNIRQFDKINGGRWYPYKFDRRHYFTLVANYAIKKDISLSSSFIFNTGSAITLPDGKYFTINPVENNEIDGPTAGFNEAFDDTFTYAGRNQSRMPSYHKLDLAVHFTKDKRKGTREWIVSIYNAYCKQNPYFVYLDYDKSQKMHLYQISIFPIIPSVSYVRSF